MPLKAPIEKHRTCSVCKSHTTTIQSPHGHNRFPTELWLKDGNGGWKCWTCKNRENSRNQRHKQIRYKDKLYTFNEKIRTGICRNCNDHTRTLLHHKNYSSNNPLDNTVELCHKCHEAIHRLDDGRIASLLFKKLLS